MTTYAWKHLQCCCCRRHRSRIIIKGFSVVFRPFEPPPSRCDVCVSHTNASPSTHTRHTALCIISLMPHYLTSIRTLVRQCCVVACRAHSFICSIKFASHIAEMYGACMSHLAYIRPRFRVLLQDDWRHTRNRWETSTYRRYVIWIGQSARAQAHENGAQSNAVVHTNRIVRFSFFSTLSEALEINFVGCHLLSQTILTTTNKNREHISAS